MTNEQIQALKGNAVTGNYYLAECYNCGQMYPSSQLKGGEPLFSGDYGDCYCPHCDSPDSDIADLGTVDEPGAKAWNYQQKQIDALLAEREADKALIAELQSFKTAYMEWHDKTDWVQTDKRFDVLVPWGKHRADVLKAYIELLEAKTLTVNLPSQVDFDDPLSAYEAIEKCREEIKSACAAAGITLVVGGEDAPQ